MTACHLEAVGEGRFRVSGEMSFTHVPRLWERSRRTLMVVKTNSLEIDLAGIDAFDSAGLALLVAWMRWAHHRSKVLRFVHMPAKLGELARANRLGGFFGPDSDRCARNR